VQWCFELQHVHCKRGEIQLTKTAATAQGTNKGNTTAWGTSDSTETLGSATDLWGSTWTVAEVNATGFGMVVKVINANSSTRTAYVDAMALTVTYSPSGSGLASQGNHLADSHHSNP
jgi:hypothetical protein